MLENIVMGVVFIAAGVACILLRSFIVSFNRRIGPKMYGRLGEKTMSALSTPLVVSAGLVFIILGVLLIAIGAVQTFAG